jgi:ADP-ribose pyrophosphatase YjhB (NUDIX family)
MTYGTPVSAYKFCPKCGAPLSSKLLKTGEPERLVCGACEFVFYMDPKVAACTISVFEGGIVLLKRAIEPGLGKWVFPGGFVDRGESIEAAAVRETMEEVRLKVSLLGILNVYSLPPYDIVIVVYAADVLAGSPEPADEALAVNNFAPEEIPWGELAFDSTRAALKDYIRRYFPRVRVPR